MFTFFSFGLNQSSAPQQTFAIMDPSSKLCGYRGYMEAMIWEKALWNVHFTQFCPKSGSLSIKRMNSKPLKAVSLFLFLTLPVMEHGFSLRLVLSVHYVATSRCSSPEKCLYGWFSGAYMCRNWVCVQMYIPVNVCIGSDTVLVRSGKKRPVQ